MKQMHCFHSYMSIVHLKAMPPTPPEVKLGALDLNLLVVFDAVMQERNVTRAGQRLGLSQPAMSHALSRLRHMLKDDLFIRSPKGMLPTPRGAACGPGQNGAARPSIFQFDALRDFRPITHRDAKRKFPAAITVRLETRRTRALSVLPP